MSCGWVFTCLISMNIVLTDMGQEHRIRPSVQIKIVRELQAKNFFYLAVMYRYKWLYCKVYSSISASKHGASTQD